MHDVALDPFFLSKSFSLRFCMNKMGQSSHLDDHQAERRVESAVRGLNLEG
jgi:hypothetical protein